MVIVQCLDLHLLQETIKALTHNDIPGIYSFTSHILILMGCVICDVVMLACIACHVLMGGFGRL